MTPPRVSVLTPTFNYARYLPEAIESVLQQDFRDFELLISDDASTDGSAEIIRRYAAKDERIRFKIHSRNLGMVANWNWCLSEARGEYVKFLFGDDRLACAEALSQLVGLLDENPSAVMAVSPRYLLDENSRVIGRADDLGRPGLRVGTRVIAQCLARQCNLIGEPSALLFRRCDAGRGFNPGYRQFVDEEMWFCLLEAGDLVLASSPLCCFRKHAGQQTELNAADQVREAECHRLLTDYASKPYLRPGERRRGFSAGLHYLRKSRRKKIGHSGSVLLEMERDLSARLGMGWHLVYCLHRRFVRPIQNLQRWCRRMKASGVKLPQFAVAGPGTVGNEIVFQENPFTITKS
jgi:glycosyltransferase involved in cell wall biosynthesis